MHAFIFKLPTRTGKVGQFGLVVVMAVFLSACSLSPWRTDRGARSDADEAIGSLTENYPRSSVVALDFVGAMTALPGIEPSFTTFFIDRPTSRFGEIFMSALQSAGYDLRLGRGDGGTRLDYAISSQAVAREAGASNYTFQVNAGMLRLKRSYEVDVIGVRPTSEMLLHGSAETTRVRNTGQTASSRVMPPVTQALQVPQVPQTLQVPQASQVPRTAHIDVMPKRNLYESGLSNYADFLADYDTLRRDIMVFPNDSLFMGSDNKLLAQRIVDGFDADRDVISVIGCSHGRTALDNGNEFLANGRSDRVKEEFTLAGIDADRVLDEGCWASRHFDRMPARGVVVTHKRRTRG